LLFNSPAFLFAFLPFTLVLFYTLGFFVNRKAAIIVTILASLFFYAYDDLFRLLSIIIVSITFNYLSATAINRYRSKRILTFSVVANLLTLGYFKYLGFLFQNVAVLGLPSETVDIALPIGISFFTFTQIAYLVDTYRGQVRHDNFIDYFFFVTYFPHLIAGPILHHAEIMPQLHRPETYRLDVRNTCYGISIFTFGLFKKVAIADNLSYYCDTIFSTLPHNVVFGLQASWIGALAYSLQIYFDFSGYSDMAIGLALLMNIRFPVNFFSPYKAASLVDFWRRWHMTLSRFLRDYLYISLGGSRKGTSRRYLNLILTMLLGGLWHGASWNFVLWGAIHGGALAINHGFTNASSRAGWRMPRFVAQPLTLLVVVLAWVPFRAPDIQTTLHVWAGMFDVTTAPSPVAINLFAAWLWIIGAGLVALLAPNTLQLFRYVEQSRDQWFLWRPSPTWAVACGLMFGIAVARSLGHASAFLYFRF
jgi:alginate O-acetyltransferase complex protein AlgI